jgi:4'-phosphopantetheinyl transferase EntD
MPQRFMHYAKLLMLLIWPGEPIGFMTHTEDRIQSSVTTAPHASLATSLGIDAITIASSDEAYSRGSISVTSRIETLRAV